MTHTNRNLLNPMCKVTLGAFLISFSPVFVKTSLVAPSTSAFYRVFFGAFFLLCLYAHSPSRPASLVRPLFITAVCGIFFALDLVFWHTSILFVGPGVATILGNFQVFILAAIGALVYKEKPSSIYLLSLPLAIAGLFCIIGVNDFAIHPDYRIGIYLGLLTALCYALFLTCLRHLQSRKGKHEVFNLLLVSLFTSAFLGLKMLIFSEPFSIPDSQSLFSLLGLGFISQTSGWLLIAHGLPHLRASLAGLLLLLQPALAFCWDVLLFGRATDSIQWAGLALTLSAIYLGTRARSQHT